MIDFSSTWYQYQEMCTSAAGAYILLWTLGSGPQQDELVYKCTNCTTLANSVSGSMQCKESATNSYLQNKKNMKIPLFILLNSNTGKLFSICFNLGEAVTCRNGHIEGIVCKNMGHNME